MAKKHLGFNGILHDSKTEAKASHPLAKLGFFASGKKFPQRFHDSDGTSFGAYDDFFNAKYNIHLEWKDAELNGVRTKATSDSQLAGQMARRGGFTLPNDDLKYGWNHSRNKQAIVQTALTPDRFIVCFGKAPTFTEALVYIKAGVLFCTLDSLPSFLGYLHLKQRGLSVGFSLNYIVTTDEEPGIAHAAGFTYGPAVAPPPKAPRRRKSCPAIEKPLIG